MKSDELNGFFDEVHCTQFQGKLPVFIRDIPENENNGRVLKIQDLLEPSKQFKAIIVPGIPI